MPSKSRWIAASSSMACCSSNSITRIPLSCYCRTTAGCHAGQVDRSRIRRTRPVDRSLELLHSQDTIQCPLQSLIAGDLFKDFAVTARQEGTNRSFGLQLQSFEVNEMG